MASFAHSLKPPTFRVHVSVPLRTRLLTEAITVLILLFWVVDNLDDLWSWRAEFALSILVLLHIGPAMMLKAAQAELAPEALRFRQLPIRGARIRYTDVEALELKGGDEVDIAHRQKFLFWRRTVHLKLKVDNLPLFFSELQARVATAKEPAVA